MAKRHTGLDQDLVVAVNALRRTSAKMKKLIDACPVPAYRPTRNTFRSLARAIVYQQLSTKAATTIYRRFVGLFPERAFPRPIDVKNTSVAKLRSAGLSKAKTAYIKDLANFYLDGRIKPNRFRKMSDLEVGEVLLPVKGIGQWSVDMFLIFALGRRDVLPVGDLAIRKGMMMHFGLVGEPSGPKMYKLAKPWEPYRSVASWYMWRRTEL